MTISSKFWRKIEFWWKFWRISIRKFRNFSQITQIFELIEQFYLSILTMSSWVKWERSNRLNFPETIFFKSSYSSSFPFISQMWTLQHFFHSTSCSPGNFWKWMKMRDSHWSLWQPIKTYSEISFLNSPQMTTNGIEKFNTRRHIVQGEFSIGVFILIISG